MLPDIFGCQRERNCDLVIRNAIVYDGSGGAPIKGDVDVNGVQVHSDFTHTGATPGRVVRGPGWKNR